MNLHLKLFLVFAALSSMMVLLFSCGAPQNENQNTLGERMQFNISPELTETVTIKFSSFELANESAYSAYEAAANAFMKINPTIKVELDGSQPYSSYLDKLLENISDDSSLTVAHIRAEWLPALLETGAVRSVAGIDEQILQTYTNMQLESVSDRGILYALPWYYGTQMLFYNTTLLNQAQVIPEEIQSMGDLLAAAKKVSALEDGLFGLAFPSSGVMPGEGYHVFPMIWANGGDLWNEEGELAIDNPAGMRTYEQLRYIFEEKISPQGMTSEELRGLFGEGKIGFLYDVQAGIADCAAAADTEENFYSRFGYMEIPGSTGYIESHLLVVLHATDDARLSAARQFLEYMSGDIFFDKLNEKVQGYLPARNDVLERTLQDADALTLAFADAAARAREIPYMRLDFVKADADLTEGLLRISSGEKADAVLSDIKERLPKYLR